MTVDQAHSDHAAPVQAPGPGALILSQNGRELQELALLASGSPLTIGRLPENQLALNELAVSRKHAEVRATRGGVFLTDLGSTYGTHIDGHKLAPQQPVLLRDGQSFIIHDYVLTFRAARAAPALSEADEDGQAAHAPPAMVDVEPRALPVPMAEVQASLQVRPVRPLPPARPTYLPTDSTHSASIYLDHLPTIFQDNSFMSRYLLILESTWEPLERRQDHLAMYFDPKTCPARMLPWLASWLDVHVDYPLEEGRLRALAVEASDLHKWRGTRYGMAKLLEVCTGFDVDVTDSTTEPFVLHVRVTAPTGAHVDRLLLDALVHSNKPAHCGFVLEVTTRASGGAD